LHIDKRTHMEVLEKPMTRLSETQFEALYERCFPMVAAFVSKMRGTLQDAQDIFHDALVIYHEKMLKNDLQIKISPEAYTLGIAKHLWVRKFNHDKKNMSFNDLELTISIPDDYFPSVNEKRLMRLLEATGKKCLELLSAFYFDSLAPGMLLQKFGFRTAHSASVQKYKCIEKMRETLKQNAMTYADFLE
jgi:DNA-directed RNA polymerase specialized sigma24 family protein